MPSAARAASVASWIFLAACAAHAASNLFFVYRYWWPLPAFDQQLWIEAVYDRGPWYALTKRLFEHRPVLPSLFYLIDWYLLQGRYAMLEIAVICLQATSVFFLLRPLFAGAIPAPASRAMAGLALVLATWLLQCENLCWPLEVNFMLGTLSVIAACWHGSRALTSQSAGTWSAEAKRAAPAVAWAAAGTFSLGNAVVLWPLLTGLSLIRQRAKLAAVFASSGVAAMILHGVDRPPSGAITDPASLLNFAIVWLARPAAPAWVFNTLRQEIHGTIHVANMPWLWAAGGVLVALLSYLLAQFIANRRSDPVRLFYLSIACAIAMTAPLVGYARGSNGVEAAFVSRYASVQWVFWFSLLALVTLRLFESPARLRIAAWAALVAGLAIHTLPANREMGAFCRERAVAMRQNAFALRAGVYDERAWTFAVFDAARFRHTLERMRRDRKNLFAGDQSISPVGDRFGGDIREDPCEGEVWGLREIAAGSGAARTVYGWAWNSAESREVESILLVRPGDGTIVGAGIPGTLIVHAREITRDPAKWNAGFTAHTRPAPSPEPFQIWAGLGGNRYCKLGPVQP